MGLKDLIITPVIILIVLMGAYLTRPFFTDSETRKFFMPALVVRIIGAISIGLLYQFYYGSGDTFIYHTHGSSIIYNAIIDNPLEGFSLLFSNGDLTNHPYKYIAKIKYFSDPSSFMVVRISTFFDLLTFSTYSATAVLFSLFNFSGMWCLFSFFKKVSGSSSWFLAFGILFAPSVVFWGSGILKDSITLSCIGWLLYSIHQISHGRKFRLFFVILTIISFYLLYKIKLYILLCLLPGLIVYYYLILMDNIRPTVLRYLITPVMLTITGIFIYLFINNIASVDSKYHLDNLALTAQTTAYDIAYWTGKEAGSTYDLGELDGTFNGMLKLAPKAINVSLFRPYIWEIRNPLMLLSSGESLILLVLTIIVLARSNFGKFIKLLKNPIIVFSLSFALIFAFGVGVSTFNFGSLSRYRIPLIPFYISGLVLIYENLKKQSPVNQS
jgi:hypothetical protein